MVKIDLKFLKKAFQAVASEETCCYPERYDPKKRGPLDGHCGAVATTLQGVFGGEIVTGRINNEPHYWNRLPNGEEIDLTSCQFGGDGFKPLKKGRKVKRGELTNLRFLSFAAKVMDYISPNNQSLLDYSKNNLIPDRWYLETPQKAPEDE